MHTAAPDAASASEGRRNVTAKNSKSVRRTEQVYAEQDFRGTNAATKLWVMLTLGIETSCDETSAAVVADGRTVRSCIIASSKLDFERLGGVIPEEAARAQLESVLPVIHQALKDAAVAGPDLSLIAVTNGPGLLGSLLVGTTTARAMASIWNVPLIGVHHTLGHLSSTWLTKGDPEETPRFPVITLSISGGHTDLWYRTSHTDCRLLGTTRDDAAGEAFDKGAVMLGLPYPGGPHLMKRAVGGDIKAHAFPLPLRSDDGFDFSFSGLKTSLKYLLRDLPTPYEKLSDTERSSVAASYQHAICLHLSRQTAKALEANTETAELHVVGGVAANTEVRVALSDVARSAGVTIRFPMDIRSCTDNGSMIAAAGYFLGKEKPEFIDKPFTTKATLDLSTLFAAPSIEMR